MDDGDASQAPFVEANREVVPERVGVEIQSHDVEALEDDVDQEREEVPVDSRSAAGIPVRTDFRFLSRQWETPNVSCPQWWMDQVGMWMCSP